ncbi:MAG TPA: hypothetical protein PKN48_08105 [Bacteroidales bacterium]|nr:hypothetical protein [Bacteroidales bacterium]
MKKFLQTMIIFKISSLIIFNLILMLSSVNAVGQVYKKTIFSTPIDLQNINIFDPHYTISIEATSSAIISIVFVDYIYLDKYSPLASTVNYMTIPSTHFSQIVGFFKKYIEWHELAISNNVDLTKSIGSIDASNVMCVRQDKNNILFGPDTTFNNGQIKFDYDNNELNITSDCLRATYDYTGCKAVANALTGSNFEKLKVEIDQKVKLWDKFK